MSESTSGQPMMEASVTQNKSPAEEVVEIKGGERKPWSLALIDVAVTVLMVGVVLMVLNFVTTPGAQPVMDEPAVEELNPAAQAVEKIDVPPLPGKPKQEVALPSSPHLDTVANIEGDQHRQRDLVLVGQGWVETLAPLRVGQRVFRGQLLTEVYSPALIDLQMEYRKAIASGDVREIQLAYDYLTVYGQSRDQIEAVLERERLDGLIRVRAPSDGVISAVYIEEGMFVPMAGPMVRLVDMSSVWMESELLNSDAKGIEPGSVVEAFLPKTGETITGMVEYVEFPGRRVGPVKVRMRFDGVEHRSVGRGYVDVRIHRVKAITQQVAEAS